METAATDRDKLAEPRHAYGEVETALLAALAIDDAWRAPFRARVKHFLRLGALGARSRRGASITYSFEAAARLAILFLIADVGLDPGLSVRLVEEYWEKELQRRVRQAVAPGSGGNPWFMTLRLAAMRGPWAGQSVVVKIGAFQRTAHRPPLSETQITTLKDRHPDDYKARIKAWKTPAANIDLWLDHPEDGNVCVFPLSYVLHRLKGHLDGSAEGV
jgi:hypothetical protein